ncbi:hypothetical protein NJB93_19105 [Brucella intermedia]|uniref:hypothetical protein n=1 Tax=Brucella intermedia TaxID=94625 RepID=UPI000EFD57D2|nr:hypothetical protein [Brucella intermedia]MCO7728696.1 hypothetical protein [Brucella intermedia]
MVLATYRLHGNRSATAFDPRAYEPNPPNIIVVPPPQYLAEVQGFDVIPTIVKADGAGELPGARLL